MVTAGAPVGVLQLRCGVREPRRDRGGRAFSCLSSSPTSLSSNAGFLDLLTRPRPPESGPSQRGSPRVAGQGCVPECEPNRPFILLPPYRNFVEVVTPSIVNSLSTPHYYVCSFFSFSDRRRSAFCPPLSLLDSVAEGKAVFEISLHFNPSSP